MELLKRYFELRKLTLFIGIVSVNILLALLSRYLLVNEIVFYNTYSEQLTYERAMNLFENARKFSWIGYVLIPVILIIKFALITTVIYIGLFFFEITNTISFGKILGVVIASEAVFISAGFIKLFWLYFFVGNYDLNDISFFYPLSLSNFFNFDEVSRIWVFPLQIINLFQILYILLLSYGLQLKTGISRSLAEKSVLSSYLPGLVLMISIVMFLTLDKTT
jgi:hypothetical protein